MQELINSKHSARIAQEDNDREDNIRLVDAGLPKERALGAQII